MLGATGSGKSFLLNFLVMHAQKYDPLTVIFDLGHSYRKLATLLDGSYLALGPATPGRARSIRSRSSPRRRHLHFLHAFVRVLLEGADSYRLSDAEDRELYEAIENLYVLDPAQRRLFTLANLLPRALGRPAHEVGRGRTLRRPLRPRRRHVRRPAVPGVRLRGDARVPGAARAAALLRAAPGRQPHRRQPLRTR